MLKYTQRVWILLFRKCILNISNLKIYTLGIVGSRLSARD